MAMGGHVFRRIARRKRFAKHDHQYVINNVGAGLQREVCRICGKIRIKASPPANLRATRAAAEPVPCPSLTVVLEEAVEPVGLSRQFADRRARP